ncbi:MAG: protein kinase domain-containing protein [Verrucomicrobiaceae bacterium]
MSEDSSVPTSFVAPSPEEIAPHFPAYEVESFIAQGGMGAVYKATQKSLDRPVAIKILPREFGEDPQFRESFEAEAKAMARLNHPNLIGVYDFGDVDGMLFIIMEFVIGKALFYSIHKKAIEPATAIKLISQICRGLDHAHKGGILHRDIKPANILLDADATPKVGDFGLARSIDAQIGEGLVYGTPGYTAPEVYTQGHNVDQRSDIFSVGAMLFEMVKGRSPENGATGMTTGLDPRFDAILAKATHADPNQRYDSVATLADDLEALAPRLSGPLLTTSVPRPTDSLPHPPLTTLKSAKSSSLPLVMTLLVLAIGGAVAFVALSDKSPKESPGTEAPPASTDPAETAAEKPDRKKTQKPDKTVANKKDPNKKPPAHSSPDPVEPMPEKPVTLSPLDSLESLQETLKNGTRDKLPVGAITRGDSSYFLYTENSTWTQAQALAERCGASLATISNTEDLNWIKENFSSNSPVWIGGSDSGTEAQWNWLSGAPFDASLWAAGSPDNDTSSNPAGQDFTALTGAGIADVEGNREFPALFEWKMDGSNPGSEEAQLARTAEALKAGTRPVFPASAFEFSGTRYMLMDRKMTAYEAYEFCKKYEGHLAVLSSAQEAAFLTKMLDDLLLDGESCWFGAFRPKEDPASINNVTGEIFDFHTWLPHNPDNKSGLETALEYDNPQWIEDLGFNDTDPTLPNRYFILEWSHPSQRNMPEAVASPNSPAESPFLQQAEEIRLAVRNKHGRDYQRFRRKYDDVISDFVRDATRRIKSDRDLNDSTPEELVATFEGYDENHALPDRLPPAVPARIRKEFKEVQEEVYELWEDYKEDFADARIDYINLLRESGTKALRDGNKPLADALEREVTAVSADDKRLHVILDGQIVLPLTPVE